jgi:hypothetical protein
MAQLAMTRTTIGTDVVVLPTPSIVTATTAVFLSPVQPLKPSAGLEPPVDS